MYVHMNVILPTTVQSFMVEYLDTTYQSTQRTPPSPVKIDYEKDGHWNQPSEFPFLWHSSTKLLDPLLFSLSRVGFKSLHQPITVIKEALQPFVLI